MNIGDINIDSLYIGDIKALSGCIGSEVVWWDSGSTPTPPTPPEPVGPLPPVAHGDNTPLSFLMLKDGYVGLRCLSGGTSPASALGFSKSLKYYITDPVGTPVTSDTLTITNQSFGQTELVFVESGYTISFYAPDSGGNDGQGHRGLATVSIVSVPGRPSSAVCSDGFYVSGASNDIALVYGNIMSLVLSEEEFSQIYGLGDSSLLGNITLSARAFAGLFFDTRVVGAEPTNSRIVFPSNIEDTLVLPLETLDCMGIYSWMFQGNIRMEHAPVLPATAFTGERVYDNMFAGCTGLTQAPALPATTLANYCYGFMFAGCTSLTTAPELPATALTTSCYVAMFSGCTGLTTAPELPATTLSASCYEGMFRGCISLTTAPELPATTLLGSCYAGMFQGCISLTTAPELPATTLTTSCYANMFNGCTSLNYVKCLATSRSSSNSTSNWLNGVSSTGTFVKHPNASFWSTGVSGIPDGWTVQDATV